MGAVGTVTANVGANPSSAINSLESVKNAVNKVQEDKFVNDMVKDATSSLPINEVPKPSDLISNGDVQSAVEAYVMQFGGNEEAILKRIQDGIEKVINVPPMASGQFWNNNDLDKALQYVKARKDVKEKILKNISKSDQGAVSSVISDGWAEAFDKYDSDVAEQFISAYEKLFKK